MNTKKEIKQEEAPVLSASDVISTIMAEMRAVEADLVKASTSQASDKKRVHRLITGIYLLVTSLVLFSTIVALTSGLSNLFEMISSEKVRAYFPIVGFAIAGTSTILTLLTSSQIFDKWIRSNAKVTIHDLREKESELYGQVQKHLRGLLEK